MHALYVQGHRGAVSAAGVKLYRQSGVVVARNFFSAAETAALTAAVRVAAERRGTDVFPALDPALAGEVHFDGQLQPKPSVDWDRLNAAAGEGMPRDVRSASRTADAGGAVTAVRRDVRLRYRNQRQVDRAYRRLARRRAQYSSLKGCPRLLTDEEERSGTVDPERLAAAQKAYMEAQMHRDFEEYKSSGQLERQIRRENHIDDTFAFVGAWAKCWSYLAATDAPLHALVTGDIGRRIGEAAAALSGEVVVRLFADSAFESYPFLNATPMLFAAAGCNYVSPTALSVLIGLADPAGEGHAGAQRTVVVPGSHTVTRALTEGGADLARFRASSIFDFGRALRGVPELQHLPTVALPPLEAGAVLFISNFTIAGTAPTLVGSALSPYRPPAGRRVDRPFQYSLSLIPDRCAFDGERNSWAARDSHGPLHAYEKGDLLTDNDKFPVLHRALDIE